MTDFFDIIIRGDSTDAQGSLGDLSTTAKATTADVEKLNKHLEATGGKSSSSVVSGVKKMGDAADTNAKKIKSFGREGSSIFGQLGMESLGAAAGSDALGTALGTLPLGPVAGGAAALAAAVLLLGNHESYTERMTKRLDAAQKNVNETMAKGVETINRLHDITGDVISTQNELDDSTKQLTAARKEADQILTGFAKGSTVYAKAAGDVVAAERSQATTAIALEKARSRAAAALQKDGAESLAYRDASLKVTAADEKNRQAKKMVAQAQEHLTEMMKGHSKESRPYRDKLLEINQLEAKQRDMRQKLNDLGAEGVKVAKDSTTVTERTIKSLRGQKDVLEALNNPFTKLTQTTEQQQKNSDDLAAVTRKLAAAERGAADQHKKTATDAANLAAQTNHASGEARGFTKELQTLAATNLNLSAQAAAINSVMNAANSAAGAVNSFVASLWAAQAAPTPSAKTPSGGKPTSGGKATNSLNAYTNPVDRNRGRYMRRTIEERVNDRLGRMSLDDSLQDKQTQTRAEQDARRKGLSGEGIRLSGEKAVIERRRAENKQRQAIVVRGIRRVRVAIAKALKNRDRINAALRKTKKGSTGWKANQEKLDKVRQTLGDLYNQEAGLINEAADLAAEAAELGFDSSELEQELRNVTVTTSAGDLALALAQLTPDTADDAAAVAQQRREAEQELAAAQQSGDRDRIIEAANRVAGFTTGGSGGSSLVVNQFFPAGMAANSPQILQAAAYQQLRIAQAGGVL